MGARSLFFIIFFTVPGLILVWTEGCSQMKSAATEGALFSSSDKNICSQAYAPTVNLSAKTTDNEEFVAPFAQQKVLLDSAVSGKTLSSYKGKTVEVLLKTACTPQPGSLSSSLYAKQTDHVGDSFSVTYQIENDWTREEVHTQADEDPCVLGLTWPGRIRTSSLELPDVNDTQISRQESLGFTNYAHAYDYLVKKQQSTSTIRVGLVDTGIDCSHTDLAQQLVSNCGRNILNSALLPTDSSGHGTHVGGIVSAHTNNSSGVAGIAGSSSKLYAIKIIDVDEGNSTDAYNGIQHAIFQGVAVINLSIQASGRLPTVEQAIADAVNAGIVVVMAAGNTGSELGTDVIISPAIMGYQLRGAITVGSVDARSGKLSYFSNFGDKVEIAAPGSLDSNNDYGIYSTYSNNSYQRLQGTSQAAPVITGAVALVVQFLRQNGKSYSAADIENIVGSSTDLYPTLNVKNGRVLNFSKLVRNTYAFSGIPLCD